jgi:class 3 adenylate cyclase/tetratricopeptide (TPR) repeat protein
MQTCPRCGYENAADARFCSGCGAPLEAPKTEAREERKVVSVLFADLVGFTSHAEQLDPEDVRATLSPYYGRLRSELERHGGTVEKFIGDAVMAVFGAPAAHEDDPERAVRAGLAIRDAIVEDGRLQVRVAVTTGEALVSLDAAPSEGEGMVAGDVVNTAARLQSAAPVNGVLVDETTHRATAQQIDYRLAEPVAAKGKAEPVAVWVALQARSRFGVDFVQEGAGFVGRRRELSFLTDALAHAREERTPQLVTLVGVPGIGKSRLVYELSRVVDQQPDISHWRQGRSLPYGEGVTYWALGEMTKAQAGILETDSPAVAEEKLAATVSELVDEGAERVLEHLRPLVGLGAAGAVTHRDERGEYFVAWRQFFEALADKRPTVLVFEDLHWADEDLLDFVDHLVDWSAGVPLLVVCTARPELIERRPRWGGGKTNALTLSISPLSDDETALLLGELLERSVLPAELQRTLLERAGGNPLYAEQFARLMLETNGSGGLSLPENVQGIIAARLDGLPPEEKQLLQDAAVMGKVFWVGAVCAIGERDRSAAVDALHSLERKEFVRRERRSTVGDEQEFAFRHLLVRDVAYGQIPRGVRAKGHERAAEWIESLGRLEDHAEMLAHHYLEALRLRRAAGRPASPQLAEHARRAARGAGDRALALEAFPVAARFFEAALELWPEDDADRPVLLLSYGRSRFDDTGLDEQLLEEARDGLLSAGNPEVAAEAEAMVGTIWLQRGDGDAALEHLENARRMLDDSGPSREKAFVLQELARLLMMREDLERSIEVGSESLRMAEELGLGAVRSRNLNSLGVARILLGDNGGFDDLEEAIAIAAAANSHEEVAALANLTWMTVQVGDIRRAGQLHVRCLRAADRLGLETYILWQRAEHVFHCHWEGKWDEAIATADWFIRDAEAGAGHYMESSCRYIRGTIELARGNAQTALADGIRATEQARVARDPQGLNPSLTFEGRARLAADDEAGASAVADELLVAWSESGVRPPHESVDGAWLFLDLGRSDEFVPALNRSRAQMPWHEAARLVSAGEHVRAADVYEHIGSVPDEAYARLRAAQTLVSGGNRTEADRQLRLALAVFAQLGATAWTAEAAGLLSASA